MPRNSGGSYDDDRRDGPPDDYRYGRPSRASGERSAYSPQNGAPPRRGSTPSDPRTRGAGPRQGPPPGGEMRPTRGSRPGGPGGRGYPDQPSGRYSAPNPAQRSRPDDDYTGASATYTSPGERVSGGRGMRDRARDLSRSMSRQLSSMMESARGAMGGRRRMPDDGASAYGPAMGGAAFSAEEQAAIEERSHRRSRIRMRARKWRLSRRDPRAMWFAIGFALSAALLVSLVGAGGGGAYYAVSYYTQHQGDVAAVASSAAVGSTTIYDRNGNVLYIAPKVTGVNIYLNYQQNDISPDVADATVSTEDRTFWDSTNIGINFSSIFRSVLVDASSGGAAQGGSTITQQLVKNLILHDRSKSVQRKLNEAILSVGVTESGAYPKWKILEMYLNTIDYSDGNIGIEAAAENYFGLAPIKDATKCGRFTFKTPRTCWANQQLDWAQISMLVGVPNAPTAFKPSQFSCYPDKGKTAAEDCPVSKWDNPCIGDPSNLTNAQCYPDGYGPRNFHYSSNGHEWLAYRRAAVVLGSLLRDHKITNDQYNSSLKEVYKILLNHKVGSHLGSGAAATFGVAKAAPHFVDYVLDDVLPNQFGISDPLADGIRVYTTLDLNLDTYAIQRAQFYINQPHVLEWPDYGTGVLPPLSVQKNLHNAAIVAQDPRNGDILAMVGSVDYTSHDPKVNGFFNVATSPNRSMGSSTKPLVYAMAMQMGWNPGTIMQDSPICFPTYPLITDSGTNKPTVDPAAKGCAGQYVPHNYDATSFSGHIPMRYGLANSLNIPATEAMAFVGDNPATSAAFIAEAQRMGVTTLTQNAMGPTTALGTQNISLLQLTNAYGVFADGGKHVPPRSVLEIVDAYGTVAYKAAEPQAAQVLSPQVAYEMTSMLSDGAARIPDFNHPNPLEFTGSNPAYPANNLDFPAVAAKTGTSQGNRGPRDIVTMGYSPYMALGVWAGNSDSSDLFTPIIGIAGAGYIFHDVMAWAIKNYNWPRNVEFPVPSDMARGTFNCTTGLAPYAGQTTVQPCDNSKDPAASNPVNIWAGYGYKPQPNSDWYIQGQVWTHS